ncbi:MAG: hypothetical protein AAFY57_00935 [Cyanobacteria bacterium J06642_2]
MNLNNSLLETEVLWDFFVQNEVIVHKLDDFRRETDRQVNSARDRGDPYSMRSAFRLSARDMASYTDGEGKS